MKILVTAGATWVKVDDVRILTSRFSGKTGLFIAEALQKKGHSVTLIINPHCVGRISTVKTVYFRYFDEFRRTVYKSLSQGEYDAVIHAAAVSDYRLKTSRRGKIPSGKRLKLELVPSEKIIKRMRVLARGSLLIQFKLESGNKNLISKAYRSLKHNGSDLVVANSLRDLKRKFRAFLIDKDKKVIPLDSKAALVSALEKAILEART
jgi:phosphopantothenoylcysteine decarboxylase/phosphopantothenate--cysteine ligase